MDITRSSVDTQNGPTDWFTRSVYVDAVAAPAGSSTFAAALVHFTPGGVDRPPGSRRSRFVSHDGPRGR
jgi:hypothetical protein